MGTNEETPKERIRWRRECNEIRRQSEMPEERDARHKYMHLIHWNSIGICHLFRLSRLNRFYPQPIPEK